MGCLLQLCECCTVMLEHYECNECVYPNIVLMDGRDKLAMIRENQIFELLF